MTTLKLLLLLSCYDDDDDDYDMIPTIYIFDIHTKENTNILSTST